MSILISALQLLPQYDLPAPSAPPGMEGFNTIISWLLFGLALAAVAAIIVLAIVVATAQRNGQAAPERATQLFWIIGAVIVGSSAGAIVTAFMPGV